MSRIKTPDDMWASKAHPGALSVFLRVQGLTLRDHLQDLATMTSTEAWEDAITAAKYLTNPRDYDLTYEEAETRMLDALDKLVEQVGIAHFTLGPVLTGRLSAQLDAVIAGAA